MKDKKIIYASRLRWIYLIAAVIIIGGVMSFGAIATIFFDLDRDSALAMVWMIPPMLLVYIVAVKILIKGIEKRLGRLLTAIDRVSDGDLQTQIDLNGAEEYTEVYKKFNAMVRELSRTKEEMDSFTNEFAHEFKTPITSIKGFADLLIETGEDIETDERMEYLGMIQTQSNRLLTLSQNALLLSKVEAMQVVVGKEDFDIAEQIRKCAILLSPQMDEKELEFEMSEDASYIFNGNPEQFEHVWINLLNNAIKFTPKGGTIKVEMEDTYGNLCIRIIDSGIGMNEETIAHIFDKYYQNDSVSLTKGSGIGLSIVKRIIELNNGSISATSTPGQGSCFEVRL